MSKSNVNHNLVCEKIGWDWANKKMLVKIYDSLDFIISFDNRKPTWKNIIKHMFLVHNDDINRININGYYSTIRKILQDIKVIQYKTINGVRTYELERGANWDRFYSDEDWTWFITNTNSGGYGEIVK